MVSWVQRGGPLAEFADGYRDEFTCRGFTANSVVTHVVLMGQLSRWMDEVRVAVGVLTPAWIEEFLDSRRAQTAHVGHQWLGRYGKTDSVVTVTTLWADERLYYPVHAVPYTPARHFAKGKSDPGFRTKLAIGADLAVGARAAGFVFRAVAADSAYGDQDGFRGELAEAGLPFVMALKPRHGTWA
jgi:hypothetical protein